MGLVYAYLAAWIAGGVLLGATMLLGQPDEPALDEPGHPAPPTASLATQLAALALIGFGLGGLAAEGLGLAQASWTVGCALMSAGLLGLVGYFTVQTER
jgi:hypothetical protein